MKRITIAAALLLTTAAVLTPARAWLVQKTATATPTYQVFMGAATGGASSVLANYIPLDYQAGPQPTADLYTIFAVPGTISTMRVKINGTLPTSGKTWTVTIVKNGVDTSLACTIGSADSGVCNVSANVSFAAGDRAHIRIDPSGSPTTARIQATSLFSPTTPNETNVSMFAGLTGTGFSNSATQAQMPSTSQASLSSPSLRRYPVVPDNGTIDKLYVATNAPGTASSGKKYNYTIDKNGSASGMTVTCEILDTATSCNDITHTLSVTGGTDDVQIQAAPTSTPTAAIGSLGFRYVPATAGAFWLGYSTMSVDGSATTVYVPMTGASSGPVTVESQAQARALSMTITAMQVKLTGAPGAAASGKKKTFTLRKNGAATALTCDVVETATTCSATGSISIADDDLLATEDVWTATPSTSGVSVSYLATKP